MVRLNHDDMKQTKITMETIKEWGTPRGRKMTKVTAVNQNKHIKNEYGCVTHKVSDHHLYHESQGLAAVSPPLCS
jgi:hypothetical protein